MEPREPGRDPLSSWRLQPDGEASWTDAVDSTQDAAGARQGEQTPQGLPASTPSQDFSFIEVSGWAVVRMQVEGVYRCCSSGLTSGPPSWWGGLSLGGGKLGQGGCAKVMAVACTPNPCRTPRSSTAPCTGAVPTWGASVGTVPRPSGPGARWACRRLQRRTRGCSKTPQVGPGCPDDLHVAVPWAGGLGSPPRTETLPGSLQSHGLRRRRPRTRRWSRSLRTAGHG